MFAQGSPTAAQIQQHLVSLKKQACQHAGAHDQGSDGRTQHTTALQQLLQLTAELHAVISSGRAPWLNQCEPQVTALNDAIATQYQGTRTACRQLQDTIEEARVALEDSVGSLEATTSEAERLLSLSHRLAYSSHAPLMGQDLLFNGPFLPPFPSTFHMQLSKLNNFACLREADQARLQREQQEAAERQQEAEQRKAATLQLPPMPAGWKPGDPVPALPMGGLPPVPPGWKPGDPIPGLPGRAEQGTAVPPGGGAREPEAAPVMLDLDTGIDDDFVLNTEAVDSDSDEESDDYEEEDDDD